MAEAKKAKKVIQQEPAEIQPAPPAVEMPPPPARAQHTPESHPHEFDEFQNPLDSPF